MIDADKLREVVASGDPLAGADDLAGVVISLGLWVAILVLAPLVVLVLAIVLLPLELATVVVVVPLFVVARFAGVIPWKVLLVDALTGEESRESYRNVLTARRRIREVNADQRVPVRWAWS